MSELTHDPFDTREPEDDQTVGDRRVDALCRELKEAKAELARKDRLIQESIRATQSYGPTLEQARKAMAAAQSTTKRLMGLVSAFAAWNKAYPKGVIHSSLGEQRLDELLARATAIAMPAADAGPTKKTHRFIVDGKLVASTTGVDAWVESPTREEAWKQAAADAGPSIVESLEALREAGGKAWDDVAVVEAELGREEAVRFSERNRRRCESPHGFNHKLDSWSLSDWMTATVGELGEAANVVKKLNRVRDGIPGNAETPEQLWEMLAEELADAAIYLDLMAQAAGFDLEKIREWKFSKTSRKIGYEEPS